MGELAEGEAEVRIVLAERSIAIGVKATSLPRMLVSQLASSVEALTSSGSVLPLERMNGHGKTYTLLLKYTGVIC